MADPDDGRARVRAAILDAQFKDADREDIDYYRRRTSDVDGPVLEIGCGTGRVYLELLDSGIDIDGFDLSEDALAVLRENAADRGVDPSVWQADMTEFEVAREYELVICPFNTFQNLLEVDQQRATLEAVYDALAPGGVFVFDVFVPGFDYICSTYGEWRSQSVAYRGQTVDFRTRSRIVDELNQVFLVEREANEQDGTTLFTESQRLKLLPYREVALLARQSPFASWEVTGDYTEQALSDGHTVQVWTLHKAEEES